MDEYFFNSYCQQRGKQMIAKKKACGFLEEKRTVRMAAGKRETFGVEGEEEGSFVTNLAVAERVCL